VPSPIALALAAEPDDIRNAALARLSEDELTQIYRQNEPLAEFVPRVTPTYAAPNHLGDLVQILEKARDTEMQVVIHAPPRHTKTETILHAIAQMVSIEPHRTNAYITYSADLARSKSRKCRMLAHAAGVRLADDGNRLEEWRTDEGGGLLATGIGGPLTGHGVSGLLIVDDPFKNRAEAESAATRERNWEWFNDVAYTRREPGCSVIVVATRWHPQDLSGKLISERGWRYVKLPAISEHGTALWPERFSLDELAKIREQVGEYTWASLYQGEPRNRGGSVFGDVHTFDLRTINTTGFRSALGADLAYSTKKYADYSVAMVMAEHAGTYYVLHVERRQCKAPEFDSLVKALKQTYGVHRSRWYTNTVEEGLADMIGVKPVLAKEDKFIRAQPVAAAWNAGKILVPQNAPWVDAFVSEVAGFTGIDDDHDDQVDALAAAFDELARGGASYEGLARTEMQRRM